MKASDCFVVDLIPVCVCVCVCVGFTNKQSECIVYSLVQLSQAKMDFINKNVVTKLQQVSCKIGLFNLYST